MRLLSQKRKLGKSHRNPICETLEKSEEIFLSPKCVLLFYMSEKGMHTFVVKGLKISQ